MSTSDRGGPFKPGTKVAERFEVVVAVGRGASGTVYRAKRLDTGATVALKVIHRHLCADSGILARFQREARALASISSEHVVRLHEVVEEDGLVVLVLDFVEGASLEELLAKELLPPLDRVIGLGVALADALESAHDSLVVHRDLKPANVLVRYAKVGEPIPEKAHIRIVDFGLSKVLARDLPPTGLTERDIIVGTPEYMAPEQIEGEEALDHRVDLYALGIILYEMIVGKVPYGGNHPMASLSAHLEGKLLWPRKAAPDRGVSPVLEAVVVRALARRPNDRYANARELREALLGASAPSFRLKASKSFDAMGDTALELREAARQAVEVARDLEAKRTPVVVDVDQRGALGRTMQAAEQTLPIPEAVPVHVDDAEPPSSEEISGLERPRRRRRKDTDVRMWLAIVAVAAIVSALFGAWLGGQR